MRKNSRFLFLFFAAALALIGCEKKPSDGYVVRGTIDPALGVDTVYLYNETKNETDAIAHSIVKDGKFVLTGKVDTIQTRFIGNYSIDLGTGFPLENDEYKVDITPRTIRIFGGKINEIVYSFYNGKGYNEVLKQYFEKEDKLLSIDIEDESKEDEFYEIRNDTDILFDSLVNMESRHFYKVIKDESAPTIAKMFALTSLQDYDVYGIKKRLKMLNEYEKELGPHPQLVAFRNFLHRNTSTMEMKKSVANGSPYKPVVGLDPTGKKVSITNFVENNEYTLLEFWASWCGPCRGEMPNLKKAYETYKEKGFEVYAFSIDESKKQWEIALEEENTPWINVLSTGEQGKEIATSYGVDGVPSSFLIDKNGVIVASNDELRGIGLEETLAKLLDSKTQ